MHEPSLGKFFSLLAAHDPRERVAIDVAHCIFLFGAIVSCKPMTVLEIGIGSGLASWTILHALEFNRKGTLTCVDNWCDTGGIEPPCVQPLRDAGALVIAPIEEEAYVRACRTHAFDVIVCDADHNHSDQWVSEYQRICCPGGFLFFHDTNDATWRGLYQLNGKLWQFPRHHFVESSRNDERCERGWLFVINSAHKS